MLDAILSVLSSVLLVAVVYGLVFWSNRARTDRSANVGIYLLFGLPGGLLSVAGLALATNGMDGGLLILGLGLAFSLPLIRPFRKLVASVTPMDPASPIDLSGLAMILAVMTFLVVQAMLTGPVETDSATTTALTGNVVWLVLNAATFVLVAYAAVGYRIHRTGPQATERLGLRAPDLKTIGLGLAFVIPSFAASTIGSILTAAFQPDVVNNLEETMEQMTSGLQNPIGALFIGLSAGIGEEVLFRGAVQPRYGIVIAALFWTALHVQYDFSFVLLGLFGVGVILGLERRYFGTTAAIITHAVYNIIAVGIQFAV
ncbi:MAG TPA: CPBP family intramembrane glutamic endopeptidase [Thermomicrobiales bacterium]|nr:CPBP family intramembrane glutamic endopeptidase [Thermomicrobiales bacterium]